MVAWPWSWWAMLPPLELRHGRVPAIAGSWRWVSCSSAASTASCSPGWSAMAVGALGRSDHGLAAAPVERILPTRSPCGSRATSAGQRCTSLTVLDSWDRVPAGASGPVGLWQHREAGVPPLPGSAQSTSSSAVIKRGIRPSSACVVMIVLFYWLVRRAFDIGRTAPQLDRTSRRAVANGIGVRTGWQDLHQHGRQPGPAANQGSMLPLVSYGGLGHPG